MSNLSVIEKFITDLKEVLESNVTVNEALDRYLNLLDQETNFTKQNFDYILKNFKKTELFNKKKYKEVSQHQHDFILSLIWQLTPSLPSFIANYVFGVENMEVEMDQAVRRLMPKPEFKNTFPFEEMRPVQSGIFAQLDKYLQDPNITDIIIDAPTGVGKSGIAIASLLRNSSGYLATANKALQDQYISEFNWLSDLRGRSNYRCNVYEGFDCRSAPCQRSKSGRNECREQGSCDYGEAKGRALQDSKYSLMNMHTLIAYSIYAPQQITERQILVIDEAHSFPEVISSSVGLSLRLKSLTPYGISQIPEYKSPARYIDWLSGVLDQIKEDDSLLDEEDAQLADKIAYILTQLDSGNIALDHERDVHDVSLITVLKMHPVRVEKYYNSIKRLAPIRIHLSATILGYETYCSMLGIESHNVAILRAGSPFAPQIRPIYLSHAVGQLNMKSLNSLMPDVVKQVENLMDHYQDYRGIIHGTTYNICNQIYTLIRPDLRGRLLFARSSREQAECLQRHMESKNTMLLSPSMTEGVDLKNDLSRLQIMVKIPYPYLGDPLIQKRKEIYFGYYEMLTATTIMQAYGRSTRNEQDWCHTFVLDTSFTWFIKSNPKLFPQWFLDAIVWK
jgi:ATP-dependent DNA helicase DinG